jgi:hypothetical protein
LKAFVLALIFILAPTILIAQEQHKDENGNIVTEYPGGTTTTNPDAAIGTLEHPLSCQTKSETVKEKDGTSTTFTTLTCKCTDCGDDDTSIYSGATINNDHVTVFNEPSSTDESEPHSSEDSSNKI